MSRNQPAPIALFVYNRPEHTRKALQALAACEGAKNSALFIFSDAAKDKDAERKVRAVQDIIANAKGFRSVEIIKRISNMGSAGSIIHGINFMLSNHERAIFIEDDLICAPRALNFLNHCLDVYSEQPNILSVSAFNYPSWLMPIPKSYEFDVYFSPVFSCWGWATWRRALPYIDWKVRDYKDFLGSKSSFRAFQRMGENLPDLLARQQSGELDDWVLPLTYSQFKNGFLTVLPTQSLIDNIGHDGSGLHCKSTELFRNETINRIKNHKFPSAIFVDDRIMRANQIASSNAFAYRLARRVLDFGLRLRRNVSLLLSDLSSRNY